MRDTAKRFFISSFLLLSGCSLFEPASCPFSYVSVELVKGAVEGIQERLGIHYYIRNTCSRSIMGLEASFFLYDDEGNQVPEFGRHCFHVSYNGLLAPGEERGLASSLDQYFPEMPPYTITVDQFHVYKIVFSDAFVWRDYFDQFVYSNKTALMKTSRGGPALLPAPKGKNPCLKQGAKLRGGRNLYKQGDPRP